MRSVLVNVSKLTYNLIIFIEAIKKFVLLYHNNTPLQNFFKKTLSVDFQNKSAIWQDCLENKILYFKKLMMLVLKPNKCPCQIKYRIHGSLAPAPFHQEMDGSIAADD